MNSSPFRLSPARRSLAALALAAFSTAAHAQTPVLRWAFDDAKGAPVTSTWISGGVLRIDGDRDGYATFQPGGGVSPVTPGVYNGAANVYGNDYTAAQITSAGSPLLADAELPQFVVTMWVKPTTAPVDQPYARLLILSPAEDEKSKKGGLFIAFNQHNLEFGVNGNISMVTLDSSVIRTGEWNFIVFAYDGFAANPYFSPEMHAALGSDRNGVVLIGHADASAELVGAPGINLGGPGYNQPAGPMPLNGLSVALGSGNSNRARAFRGLIDDVRIYGGLLNAEQIEAARRSSLPKP